MVYARACTSRSFILEIYIGSHHTALQRTISKKGIMVLDLTKNSQIDGPVYFGLGVDLALVDALVPGLHVIYSQIPIVRSLSVADNREPLVARVRERHRRQDMQIPFSYPGYLQHICIRILQSSLGIDHKTSFFSLLFTASWKLTRISLFPLTCSLSLLFMRGFVIDSLAGIEIFFFFIVLIQYRLSVLINRALRTEIKRNIVFFSFYIRATVYSQSPARREEEKKSWFDGMRSTARSPARVPTFSQPIWFELLENMYELICWKKNLSKRECASWIFFDSLPKLTYEFTRKSLQPRDLSPNFARESFQF